MPCSCKQKKNNPPISTTDRYITFDGIDCDGNARILMSLFFFDSWLAAIGLHLLYRWWPLINI